MRRNSLSPGYARRLCREDVTFNVRGNAAIMSPRLGMLTALCDGLSSADETLETRRTARIVHEKTFSEHMVIAPNVVPKPRAFVSRAPGQCRTAW